MLPSTVSFSVGFVVPIPTPLKPATADVPLKINSPSEESDDLVSLKKAIYRLKYDEHFFLQLLMALKKKAKEENIGRVFSTHGKYEKDIFNNLDFTLTKAQINVLKDIRNDLSQKSPMNLLIQGDVGSGKTIVAVLAAAIVISHGSQVAVMAPTEILAEQHYRSFLKFCEPANINIALLIGSQKKVEKEKIYSKRWVSKRYYL